jgi:hypothetical protein
LNFYSSTIPQLDPTTEAPRANLAQLLEFLHVPLPFAGTDTRLNPEQSAAAPATPILHPPFNRISSYREPGKLNLNTAYEREVIDALRGSPVPRGAGPSRGIGPYFEDVVDSRRGVGLPTGIQFTGVSTTVEPASIDQTTPTFFANPFRSFGGSQFPLFVPDTAGGTPIPVYRPFVETTFLRSDRVDHRMQPPWPVNPASGGLHNPLLASTPAVLEPHNNPVRNPYFRYLPLQRLGNSVTTRSNVYAIWVTVGLFEVEHAQPDPTTSPFGYRLGAELGWDTGDLHRHRAFYVVDRSIPVAFEPGKRHNAERAVLLRRFIE